MNGDETLKKQESHEFIHGSVNSEDADVESLLGSVCRLRILKRLAESPGEEALTLYRLRVLTGIGSSDLRRHVDELVRSGLLKEVKLCSNRKYALDRSNPAVTALINLFKAFERRRPDRV